LGDVVPKRFSPGVVNEPDSRFRLLTQRQLRIRRIYDAPARTDGYRILVDRIWPRGISKRRAKLDAWLPELAPSAELRKWFGHDPERWPEFRKRYRAELARKTSLIDSIRHRALDEPVTLLFAARDPSYNNARVLLHVIEAA
jgi:uncharacterized protein YeaO (DUF488 family)